MSEDLSNELSFAINAAEAAGKVLADHFSAHQATAIQVDRKTGNEPVTAADRAAEKLIVEKLKNAYPQDGILSEENPDTKSWLNFSRSWVIDPMDGPRDFIAGRHGFSVMIGLLENFRPVLGVVHQPLTGITYYATRGNPAELKDKQTTHALHTSQYTDIPKLRLISSVSHRPRRLDQVKSELGIIDEVQLGSLGLKLCLIARGERDIYINLDGNCKLWDTCAPEIILAQAGGRLTNAEGKSINYRRLDGEVSVKGTLIATNGVAHQKTLERFSAIKDYF